MELTEIKNELTPEDIKQVCVVTGYSRDLVYKVLNGERSNKAIVIAAEKIIQTRKKNTEKLKQELQESGNVKTVKTPTKNS